MGYDPLFAAAYNRTGIPLPGGGYDHRSSLPLSPPTLQYYDDGGSRDLYRNGRGMPYGGSSRYIDAYDDDEDYGSTYAGENCSRHYSGYNTRQRSAYYPSHGGGHHSLESIPRPTLPGTEEFVPHISPLAWQYNYPGLRLLDEGAEKPKTGLPLPPPGKDFFDKLPRPSISRESSVLSPLGTGWRPQSDAGRSIVPASEESGSAAIPKPAATPKPAFPGTPRAPPMSSEEPPQLTHPPPVWADFGMFETPRELKAVPPGLNEILDSCGGLPDPYKIIEYLREAHRACRNPLPVPDNLDLSCNRRARHV